MILFSLGIGMGFLRNSFKKSNQEVNKIEKSLIVQNEVKDIPMEERSDAEIKISSKELKKAHQNN